MVSQFLKTVRSLLSAAWDALVLLTPIWHVYRLHPDWGNRIAFLVHPRNVADIYRPYPLFRYLPDPWVERYGRTVLAITLQRFGRVGGRSPSNADRGYVLSVVMTPRQMLRHRERAQHRLRMMYRLAHRKGAKLVGLGGWVPAMTDYGEALRMHEPVGPYPRPGITTGHTYTAWAIVEHLKRLVVFRHGHSHRVRVGIVGAGGSTGSLTAAALMREGTIGTTAVDLTLVEVAREDKLESLRALRARGADLERVRIASELSALRDCDYCITVTNSPRSIIRRRHLKEGAVVIDDSQPRNTSPSPLGEGIHVVDVLAVMPAYDARFDSGLDESDPDVGFTCMAEVALLGAVGHSGDFSIGRVPLPMLDRLERYIERTRERTSGFDIAPWHAFGRPMTEQEVKSLCAPISGTEPRPAAPWPTGLGRGSAARARRGVAVSQAAWPHTESWGRGESLPSAAH